MHTSNDFAVVVPMANEAATFEVFTAALARVLDVQQAGQVYIIVDRTSVDGTRARCEALEARDPRFQLVWAPRNRHVVDAYLTGLATAYAGDHPFIIEMDAGMSHDPASLPAFLGALAAGYDCAFGSRFMEGGSMADSPHSRRMLSQAGTLLANVLLGTRLTDMTSGYQGFKRHVLGRLLAHPLRSTGHFYQTEVRYLLRDVSACEVPIVYRASSSTVSSNSLKNSLQTLGHYFLRRLTLRAPVL